MVLIGLAYTCRSVNALLPRKAYKLGEETSICAALLL